MSKNKISLLSQAIFVLLSTILAFSLVLSHVSFATEAAYAEETRSNCTTESLDDFTDINPNAWYINHVKWMYENNLMTGYSDSAKFGVNDDLTRAQLATILARHSGADLINDKDTTGLSDLKGKTTWYTGACNWAVSKGIISGYVNKSGVATSFGPNDPVTREQAIVILTRYAKAYGTDVDTSISFTLKFADKNKISRWARSAVAWASEQSIVSGVKVGKKSYLEPTRNIKRSEMAKIIHLTIDVIEQTDLKSPAIQEPQSMSPNTLKINGKTISYIESYDWSSAPLTGAGLWRGDDSTTDGSYGYFIGHNPGSFKSVMSLKIYDQIAVCDSDNKAKYYYVVDVFDVPRGSYWSDISERVTKSGESVILQTCNGPESYRIVVCVE